MLDESQRNKDKVIISMDEFVKGILKDFSFDHETSNSSPGIHLFSVDNKSTMLTLSEKNVFPFISRKTVVFIQETRYLTGQYFY